MCNLTLMRLHVPFANFADAVQRELMVKTVYVQPIGNQVLVTAASVTSRAVIHTQTTLSIGKVKASLNKLGFEVFDGAWRDEETAMALEDSPPTFSIVAIGYKSADNMPGVWVDAFESEPSQMEALKALFEEFRASGELTDIPFEDFLRLANPNVVIVAGADLAKFLAAKRLTE